MTDHDRRFASARALLLATELAFTPHSDRSLFSHLIGTYELLREWGAPSDVCLAGFLHSIYGTESFNAAASVERERVREAVGPESERLIFLISRRSTDSFAEAIREALHGSSSDHVTLRDRLTGESIPCSIQEFRALAMVTIANALEQARRIPCFWRADQHELSALLPLLSASAVQAFQKMCSQLDGSPSAIEKLPLLFTWRFYPQLMGEIATSFQQYCEHELHVLLIGLSNPQLEREYGSLPQAGRARIATTPAIVRLYGQHKRASTRRIRDAIQSERRLRLLPSADCSSLVDGMLPVDGMSPRSHMNLPGCNAKASRYTLDSISEITSKLTEALRAMRRVDGTAVQCVLTVTRLIAVRRDTARPDSFGSSSWPEEIGKIGLTNVHLPTLPMSAIASALLHESVHGLLYSLEPTAPFYTARSAMQACRIRSPWTGRELYLHSFVHACFVWFALWNFWRSTEAASVFGAETAMDHVMSAKRGFQGPSLVEMMKGAEPLIMPSVLRAIARMDDMVRSTDGLAP